MLAKQPTTIRSWITMILLLTAVAGCSVDPTRLIVIPDGYSGPILLVVDPTAPPLRSESGTIVIRIPQSGILKVQDLGPLQEMAQWKVQTYSGKKVRNEEEATSSEVAFRHGGTRSGNDGFTYSEDFVGTVTDMREFDSWSYLKNQIGKGPLMNEKEGDVQKK